MKKHENVQIKSIKKFICYKNDNLKIERKNHILDEIDFPSVSH